MRLPEKGLRGLGLTGVVALASIGGVMAVSATPAGAFEGFGFVPPSFGLFSHATGVGVDPSNGNVYVADGGSEAVDVFSSSGGAPAGGGPSTLTGAKTPAESFDIEGEPAGVAVSKSGDVYVTDVKHNVVDEFKLNPGHEYEYVSQLTGFGEPVGVAVDALGDVYVSNYESGAVEEFTAAGEKIEAFKSPAIQHPQGIAVDAGGDIYIQGYNTDKLVELTRSSPTSTAVLTETEIASSGVTAITLDRATNAVFADFGTHIVQYSSEGAVVDSQIGEGKLVESLGVAVNETAGSLDVSDNSTHETDVFAPLLLPAAVTEAPSAVTGVSATLEGTVKPEGVLASPIEFQLGTSTKYGQTLAATPEEATAGEAAVAVTANAAELEPNETYHYRLLAQSKGDPSYGQDQEFTTAKLAPLVPEPQPAAVDVTRDEALLPGVLNPEHTETTYRFQYGPTTVYGSSTTEASAGSALEPQSVAQALVGLEPGTTYHYRLIAKNEAGEVPGPDESFTTAPRTPPAATTGPASAVSQNSALITATIDSGGEQTSYGFEIGGEAGSYGPATGLGSVGAGLTETVTLTLTGLQPSTTYHYRITATNADGNSEGEDESFTTPGFPAVLSPLTAPPLLATPNITFPAETATAPGSTPKPLTRAQKLAKALKACAKQPRKKRAACIKHAKAKYGPAKKNTKR